MQIAPKYILHMHPVVALKKLFRVFKALRKNAAHDFCVRPHKEINAALARPAGARVAIVAADPSRDTAIEAARKLGIQVVN